MIFPHSLHPHCNRKSTATRHGLSIMEVLFAIGVLMIGLLGIASILPVAARNAGNALELDRTSAAMENQISNAAARLTEQLTHVDVPNHSLAAFQMAPTAPYPQGHGPYAGLSVQAYGYHVARGVGANYRRVDLTEPPIVKPSVRAESSVPPFAGLPASGYRDLNFSTLPPPPDAQGRDRDWLFDPVNAQLDSAPLPRPAFCIDPAFLTAAKNLRDDTGTVGNRNLNGYDRTMFPCYDLNYDPQSSPSTQVSGGSSFAMTPRMFRVGLPTTASTIPSNVIAESMLGERDGLPLVRPDGELKGRAPGLLVRESQRGANSPVMLQSSGRFASMIMLTPTSMGGNNYKAHIVVTETRDLTINEPGTVSDPNDVFNLEPYTAARWDLQGTDPTTKTYEEEVLGVVEYAPSPITGGVGQFTYVHSAACSPEISTGNWILLCRWLPDQAINRYEWYRVSDVLDGPALDAVAGLYRTTIEVRGADWLFHPSQVVTSGASTGAAGPFSYSPPTSTSAASNAYNRRVTTVVKMPSVISVRTMNVNF